VYICQFLLSVPYRPHVLVQGNQRHDFVTQFSRRWPGALSLLVPNKYPGLCHFCLSSIIWFGLLMMDEACCTCATLLENCHPQYDEQSEKPKALDRRLDCCRRVICGSCMAINPRFATYCIAPLHNPESFNNLQT
jgi:hypothetical protein